MNKTRLQKLPLRPTLAPRFSRPLLLSALLSLSMAIPTVQAEEKKAKPPTKVFVAEVSKQAFADEIESLGTLQANENVSITSTITELVTKVNFEDGQRVKKGDILIGMDATEIIALQQEEASRLAEAQRQVDRIKPLIERGAASKATLDEASLALQTARSRMKVLDAQIARHQITAPFDGIVGLRNISVGALAQPGMMITSLDDDAIMRLDFAVPEVFLSMLKPGLPIKARAKAYPNKVFIGSIASVNSRIDPVTRSIGVRARLANTDYLLKPGLLMRVQLRKNERQALIIPEESLLVQGKRRYVYTAIEVEAKTVAKRTEIEIGARRKGDIEVIEGLSEGDLVVTHGNLKIREGAAIEISAVETHNESLQELLNQKNSAANTANANVTNNKGKN